MTKEHGFSLLLLKERQHLGLVGHLPLQPKKTLQVFHHSPVFFPVSHLIFIFWNIICFDSRENTKSPERNFFFRDVDGLFTIAKNVREKLSE